MSNYKQVKRYQFKELYPDYNAFKKYVINPMKDIYGDRKPKFISDKYNFYTHKQLYTILEHKYGESFSVNEKARQHKLMINAFMEIMPVLYTKTLLLTNKSLDNFSIENIFNIIERRFNEEADKNYATTETSYSSTPSNEMKSGGFNIKNNVKEQNIVNRKDKTIRIKEVKDFVKKWKEIGELKISGHIYDFVNTIEIASLWEFNIDSDSIFVLNCDGKYIIDEVARQGVADNAVGIQNNITKIDGVGIDVETNKDDIKEIKSGVSKLVHDVVEPMKKDVDNIKSDIVIIENEISDVKGVLDGTVAPPQGNPFANKSLDNIKLLKPSNKDKVLTINSNGDGVIAKKPDSSKDPIKFYKGQIIIFSETHRKFEKPLLFTKQLIGEGDALLGGTGMKYTNGQNLSHTHTQDRHNHTLHETAGSGGASGKYWRFTGDSGKVVGTTSGVTPKINNSGGAKNIASGIKIIKVIYISKKDIRESEI